MFDLEQVKVFQLQNFCSLMLSLECDCTRMKCVLVVIEAEFCQIEFGEKSLK